MRHLSADIVLPEGEGTWLLMIRPEITSETLNDSSINR